MFASANVFYAEVVALFDGFAFFAVYPYLVSGGAGFGKVDYGFHVGREGNGHQETLIVTVPIHRNGAAVGGDLSFGTQQ